MKLLSVIASLPSLPLHAGTGFLVTKRSTVQSTQRWGCHAAVDTGSGASVPLLGSSCLLCGKGELWLVGGSEAREWSRRWRMLGRAVKVPVLLGGQKAGAGRLLDKSSAFLALSQQLPEAECP